MVPGAVFCEVSAWHQLDLNTVREQPWGGGQQEPRPSRWLSPWQQLVPAGEGPRNPSQAARVACIPGEGMLLPA